MKIPTYRMCSLAMLLLLVLAVLYYMIVEYYHTHTHTGDEIGRANRPITITYNAVIL